MRHPNEKNLHRSDRQDIAELIARDQRSSDAAEGLGSLICCLNLYPHNLEAVVLTYRAFLLAQQEEMGSKSNLQAVRFVAIYP